MVLLLVMMFVIIAAAFAVNNVQPANSIDQTQVKSDPVLYYLREYDEKIGVFHPDEAEPFLMIDVYVSTLPSADQFELKNSGIKVYSAQKLQSIIEDYES